MTTLDLRYEVYNPFEKSIVLVVTCTETKFSKLKNKWYKDVNLTFEVQSV
jgi:hypothetical protein